MALGQLNAEPLNYVPHNTWTVYGDSVFASEILNKLPNVVSWVGELLQTDRYPPELKAQLLDTVDIDNVPGKT